MCSVKAAKKSSVLFQYTETTLEHNLLTTDDEYTCHATLLAHILPVGTIRFEDRFHTSKQGRKEGGGQALCHDMLCMWSLSWLAVERPWSEPLLSFLPQTSVKTTPLPL